MHAMSGTIALAINKLHKIYANRFHALKGIDLIVRDGDFFALLGPNGAGKSTAIGIITSLVNPTSGQVKIYGYDIKNFASQAKVLIGLVPQEFNFNQFERAIDVVLNQAGYYGLPRKVAKARAEQYLKELALWGVRDVEMRQLSGGMKRRLMITRALMHHPRLLILDEPTAGVDIEVRRLIWKFMNQLNRQGTTIILTTHYLEEAENWCRNIAIIDQGRIIEDTTMRKLLSKLNSETYTLYLKSPLKTPPSLQFAITHLSDEMTLDVTVDGQRDLAQIFAQLEALNIPILGIRNKTNRLEELFLQIVS